MRQVIFSSTEVIFMEDTVKVRAITPSNLAKLLKRMRLEMLIYIWLQDAKLPPETLYQ